MQRLRRWEDQYPLFTTINRIINHELAPEFIIQYYEGAALMDEEEDPAELSFATKPGTTPFPAK